ncbi:nitrite reductase [Margalitia sp. FSL K6-0131]|uniref:nitrite reductase n=1 Tax=Margalitia sp. FSL K6-0131 TaxID=2954604 RepID=UPI0030FA7152
MGNEPNMVTIAVNGGIGFGAKLNSKQLIALSKYIEEDQEIELTTFQQLYLQVPEEKVEIVKEEFYNVGLSCYPVGKFVKSLRTCNFCKGAEIEGMPVAEELNRRIAGIEVPFTLKTAYTGCPVGCGEPLVNDIGIMKRGDYYDLYIGGKAKGLKAKTGTLFRSRLNPEELYRSVESLIEIYQKNGKKREDFTRFIDRFGIETLDKLIG